ncbi:MAG TPA: deoxyribose-phosphate aldolase, partial [Flavobacteriales bacterium]|nr:deoxyribose-phosphate aldolase [Flavobacteriales bacterium]
MDIKKYLDSTYLKTPEQSGLTEEETTQKVKEVIQEAIDKGFYLVMIR